MAAYDDKFDETEPAGAELANTIDDIIKELKRAIIERLATEHYDLSFNGTAGTDSTDEDAQGRHKAGVVGILGKGDHSVMDAQVDPGKGALWLTTDPSGAPDNFPAGTVYRYESGWNKEDFAIGTIYATEAEVLAGTAADKAISPLRLKIYRPNVVQAIKSDTQTWASDTAWTDLTDLSIAITTQADDSKVLIRSSVVHNQNAGQGILLRIVRDATPIGLGDTAGSRRPIGWGGYDGGGFIQTSSYDFLDTPGVAGTYTYKVQAAMAVTGYTTYINRDQTDSDSATFPRAISSLTLQEIPV